MTTYGDGTVERLPSGKFRARVYEGKRLRSLGTRATEDEAKRLLDAAREWRRTGGGAHQTVAQYGALVIERWRQEGKRSWRSDLSRWHRWVADPVVCAWALDPIDAVTRSDARTFARGLLAMESCRRAAVSNQQIKHIVNLARRVFFVALDEDELIERNPFDQLDVPQRPESDADHWTALTLAELDAIRHCKTLTFEQQCAFLLASYSGLRQGELAALRWNDVHLDVVDPHLWVCRSWSDPTTKTGRSRRVDLIPLAREALLVWRQRGDRVRGPWVWGCLYARGYDWGWAQKVDLGHGVCYLGAKRELGIARMVWFHHLRDTCASHLLTGSWGRAWTVAEVAALLGHTSTWVTERYARLLPGALAKAAAATTLSTRLSTALEGDQG